jgi:hypothetical protein
MQPWIVEISKLPEREAPLSELRLKRKELEGRIEKLASGRLTIQHLRQHGFEDVTAATLTQLFIELGEIGARINRVRRDQHRRGS